MTADADGFSQVWPTLFLDRMLPGHEQANTVLLALVEALDAERDDLTAGYRADNLFAREHPVIKWLHQCVAKTALDYLRRQGIHYPVDMRLHGWANVNSTGDYHGLHNHPHSYLSGTYYVSVPEQPAHRTGRGDLDPGAISFFDPRPQANMNAIRGDAQVDPERRVLPRAGQIMLWPAFVHHFVHPNLATEPRVSISFNVVLANADEHLPAQE